MIVTLTKDGNSQMYLINADGQRRSAARDIECRSTPRPTSRRTATRSCLVSDRGGSPQIYRMSLGSRAVERGQLRRQLQHDAALRADGKSFAFLKRDGSRFNIAIQDLASRQVQVLTQAATTRVPASLRWPHDPSTPRARGGVVYWPPFPATVVSNNVCRPP
jgi:TolB protein